MLEYGLKEKGEIKMAKVSTSITIDAEVKKQAQELFADLGMDLSTAINIYLKKAVAEQGIPFEITRGNPNQDTMSAMEEVKKMEAHPEKYTGYKDIASLKKALDV